MAGLQYLHLEGVLGESNGATEDSAQTGGRDAYFVVTDTATMTQSDAAAIDPLPCKGSPIQSREVSD